MSAGWSEIRVRSLSYGHANLNQTSFFFIAMRETQGEISSLRLNWTYFVPRRRLRPEAAADMQRVVLLWFDK